MFDWFPTPAVLNTSQIMWRSLQAIHESDSTSTGGRAIDPSTYAIRKIFETTEELLLSNGQSPKDRK